MDLARTQFLSLATKAVTTALGIAQSILVIRILSPAEFGLVGLVMSVGGVIGVSQHLGIVDGAIREIAVLKEKRDVATVYWVSHLVRQLVTIPLSLGLLLAAGMIAEMIYGRPEITLFLQIFAAVLILQGLQDVMGATLTGLRKFALLYGVQVMTAALNVAVFGYLTWRYNIAGFFWAIVVTTSVMVALLAAVIGRELRGELALPRWAAITRYAWRVMRIGAYMYVARIFFIVWQRLPILLLGGVLAAEELGYLNVSQTFGSKLTIIAMALSEVNLSWMSSLYTHRQSEFKRVVTHNMQRVLIIMMLLTLVLLFFTPEILRYVIGIEYLSAQPIILVMTLGFFLYALTDIGTSSVFVPADQPRLRAFTYGLMAAISGAVIALLLLFRPDSFWAATAVFAGALVSYFFMVVLAQRRFGVRLLTGQLLGFLLALGMSVLWLLSEPMFSWRLVVFALLVVYIVWEARRSALIPRWRTLLAAGVRPQMAISVTCFAGAAFDQPTWTNRQHIMSRVAARYPVLYIEPRVWIVRYVWQNWRQPLLVGGFFRRLLWYEPRHDNLFVKAQWNLIPGSREVASIARFNHLLNRWHVLLIAWWLGFRGRRQVMWIYDTEAAEYLSAFASARVVYDCVDDHAAQAGPNRNPQRVDAEERTILARSDLVAVTSQRLYELKNPHARNVHVVLNAGDVALYGRSLKDTPDQMKDLTRPIVGSVGALDAYKIDFGLLAQMARHKPGWNFVFLGAPVVDQHSEQLEALRQMPNVHLLGIVPRRKVPAFVTAFDVCLIPYRANRYNAASFPLKFWEFMATGKPIVVTGLPELAAYRSLIYLPQSPEEALAHIERALADPYEGSERRRALAREHSWEKRTEQLLAKLEEVL